MCRHDISTEGCETHEYIPPILPMPPDHQNFDDANQLNRDEVLRSCLVTLKVDGLSSGDIIHGC